MKKLTLITATLLAGLVAISAQAQTTNTTTDVPTFLSQTYNTLIGQGMTNLSTTFYGTYTPSLKKWGGGVEITRNLPIGGGVATGIGLGVDWYDKSFYAVNGQVSLEASMRPFSNWGGFATNIVVTPFTFIGLGTPFGGGSTANGNLETIAAVGGALYITHVVGADLNLIGIYGTRTGLDEATGTFYGGGLNLTWKF